MERIKNLAKQIEEELEDAEHYAKCAVKLKDENASDSSAYAEMARQEMGHAEKLHNMAVRLIEKQRQTGVAPPAAMLAVWEWEHEKMMDHMATVKLLLSMA